MTDQINANPEGATNNNEQQGPQIAVQRVFTKDISFEAPNSPEIFQDQDFKPEIKLDMNSRSRKLNNDFYEVVLSITLTATSADKTAFLVEVKQAGIFVAKGLEDDQLRHLLSVFCPETLYPYAREAISSLVNRGGFPPVYLAPVSFEALFRAQLAQQAQQQNDAAPATEQ